MTTGNSSRFRNPFTELLVTELLEDPQRYKRMFSERILIGETLTVFQPPNTVLLGPQGSGKSMILNLIRSRVLAEFLNSAGSLPHPLNHIKPFVGVSVNLTRVNFHAFGRRSLAQVMTPHSSDFSADLASASDFLNHYIFREFLLTIGFLQTSEGTHLRNWLGISDMGSRTSDIASDISSWSCWFGFYEGCSSLEALLERCVLRLNVWRTFLNVNIERIPDDVWMTKSTLGEPLHYMGNLLQRLSSLPQLPLYVVIDQYEALPELNKSHGTLLQRVVNNLIKARDPVVFCKIGARPYDWGSELRVWGSESRIEVQRDYVVINLNDLLMRDEDGTRWLFPEFALDVAYKRVQCVGGFRVGREWIRQTFGNWAPDDESKLYFRQPERYQLAMGPVPDPFRSALLTQLPADSSPLTLRLAGAWVLQCIRKGLSTADVLATLPNEPWTRTWWRKERVEVALLQVASLANSRRRYFGWRTIVNLAGANITAFLLVCAEIWDIASKSGRNPIKKIPLPESLQTEGVEIASAKWRERDRNDQTGGSHRYEVLSRLGPAIRNSLIGDFAISNPGHSGFSLRISDILTDDPSDSRTRVVREFLYKAVNWAILEERHHTSKQRCDLDRVKWYLHPLLSPFFRIPLSRVKEPYYTDVSTVFDWIVYASRIQFGSKRRFVRKSQDGPAGVQGSLFGGK